VDTCVINELFGIEIKIIRELVIDTKIFIDNSRIILLLYVDIFVSLSGYVTTLFVIKSRKRG